MEKNGFFRFRLLFLSAFSLLFLCLEMFFSSQVEAAHQTDFENALKIQSIRAEGFMMANISLPEGLPGSVVASPSRMSPNYFYHWTRDSALTMMTVLAIHDRSSDQEKKHRLRQILKDYVLFSRKTQEAQGPVGGPGEVRFNLDGSSDYSDWARPQNDGAALRALILTRFANVLLSLGEQEFVLNHIYRPYLPAYTVAKVDLEYVAHHCMEPSYDAWEELFGQHFFHRILQRRALLEGAVLADSLNDPLAAQFYRRQARALEPEINAHYDTDRGYLVATLFESGGIMHKNLHLDSVVILGALVAQGADDFYSVTDDRVLATVFELMRTFKELYPINASGDGIAIGRYPEDHYDGVHSGRVGNPWFLTTHAFAELFHRAANNFTEKGEITISKVNLKFFQTLGIDVRSESLPLKLSANSKEFDQIVNELRIQGDGFFKRSLRHMNQESGVMSEQLNRDTGIMQGARDLTWSYASFIDAYLSRPQANTR